MYGRSGVIGVRDLHEWLSGRESKPRWQRTRDLFIDLDRNLDRNLDVEQPGTGGEVGGKVSSHGASQARMWTAERLRLSIQAALMDAHLTPLDLLREWDKGADHTLSKREVLVMMKSLVNSREIWEAQIREVHRHASFRSQPHT